MNIQRGFRDKLEKYLNVDQEIAVEMRIDGNAVYDYCCFGVDNNDKLSDDRYMIFYNQLRSPAGEIVFSSVNGIGKFVINLSKLPASINKIVFSASIDGQGNMGDIVSHSLTVSQNNSRLLEMNLSGRDFHSEKAIISVEIYKKDVWRIAAVASGFNGGLGDLLRAFGGEEIESDDTVTPPVSPQAPQKISLEKKLQKEAPALVSLAKPLQLELEKRSLQDTIARVALVIDISGSMTYRFSNGTVQEIVNKTLPLAVQFDDDGELDFWYYGSRFKRMPSVNMKNYTSAVPVTWEKLMSDLGYGNNEVKVMEDVLSEYKKSKLPAYVIFITDGGVGNERGIKDLLSKASKYPIFWQFVGVGGSGYGVLERLDNMSGRYVDNANFFALDDFRTISNSELYSRLLNEFPAWLKEIKAKNMIR